MAVFAFSDLHANTDLWHQIRDYLKPTDTAYCLGDCIDRGGGGLTVLKEILATPNIILLRGNHEDFISQIGFKMFVANSCNMSLLEANEDAAYLLWCHNGGFSTMEEFNKLSLQEQYNLISAIERLPTHTEYMNNKGDIIYLCHAGRQFDTNENINYTHNIIPMNNYLWDRDHLIEKKWRGEANEYCVHGHTPVQALRSNFLWPPIFDEEFNKNPTAITYCEGHKIDIDLGTYESKKTCLINLDTFFTVYFTDRISKKELHNEN